MTGLLSVTQLMAQPTGSGTMTTQRHADLGERDSGLFQSPQTPRYTLTLLSSGLTPCLQPLTQTRVLQQLLSFNFGILLLAILALSSQRILRTWIPGMADDHGQYMYMPLARAQQTALAVSAYCLLHWTGELKILFIFVFSDQFLCILCLYSLPSYLLDS